MDRRTRLVSGWKRLRGDAFVREEAQQLASRLDRIEALLAERAPAAAPPQGEAAPPPTTARPQAPPAEGPRKRRYGAFDHAPDHVRALFETPRPWMVDEAVEHAASLLTRDMVGLEWGGGASTPYWCERLGVLHTFEASPGWAAILLDYMTGRRDLVDRWRLHYVGANWASVRARKRRTGRALPEPAVKQALEDDYAPLLPHHMDLIVLDGAVRQATTKRLGDYLERDRPKLVVIDNTEAEYVTAPLTGLALDAYERTDHWEKDPDKVPAHLRGRCTTVFERRR